MCRRRATFPILGFKTNGNPLYANGSFRSGHTAWAFAIATVVARRHSNHKWVPFVAYGIATVASISWLSNNTTLFQTRLSAAPWDTPWAGSWCCAVMPAVLIGRRTFSENFESRD